MVSPMNDNMSIIDNNRTLGFDAHSYTSGRWLWNDKHQRQMRRIDLNFDKLCQRIVDLFNGTKSVKDYEKKVGGFNRVFICIMDDSLRIVARLPFPFP